MKNILHEFDDLKEGQALGIVSDADDEDSVEGLEEPAEVLEVSKVLPTMWDPEDFDYNPKKRGRPAKKAGSRATRKQSTLIVE